MSIPYENKLRIAKQFKTFNPVNIVILPKQPPDPRLLGNRPWFTNTTNGDMDLNRGGRAPRLVQPSTKTEKWGWCTYACTPLHSPGHQYMRDRYMDQTSARETRLTLHFFQEPPSSIGTPPPTHFFSVKFRFSDVV